jgi:YesN/AraC family two-component response regulator
MNGFGVKSNGRDYVDENMQAGFSYHITKPVNWTELKAAIDKISDEISVSSLPKHV